MVTTVVTILVFLILITLHEFGHFAAAKLLGVKVIEFAVGMGPAIVKHQGKKTLYSLRIFPIGGYCKLEGEDEKSSDPEAFSNQKLWKRIIVVIAGAFLNLVLGFALFAVVVKMMSPIATNVIDKVDERAYLSDIGVLAGDRIVEINGHKIALYSDIGLYTDEFNEETKETEITVKRNGEKLKFKVKPSLNEIKVTYGENSVKREDTINGETENFQYNYEKEDVPKEYIGKTFSEKRYIIGFTAKMEDVTIKNVFPEAWHYMVFITKSIYKSLWEMVTGKTGLEQVSGPVGVAEVIGDAVNSGKNSLLNLLFIVAMLTVNLGIFNLLPLPALDGGRLFFMLIELVRGKPVPTEKEALVHTIGLMLLLLFAVVVCYSDILKLMR